MVKPGKGFGAGAQGPDPESEAQRLIRAGDHAGAGRLLEEAGRLSKAVDAYLNAKEYHLAADILDRLGRSGEAADWYLRAGNHRKAAEALVKAGDPARGADLLQQQGQSVEAAHLYGLAGLWDKAAELYVKGGYPLRAAQAWERHGDLTQAAECYERHFVENVSYGAQQAGMHSADRRTALQAGQLFEKAGAPARAIQIYARAGYFTEAGNAAAALGDFARAAELFAKADELDVAAACWERAGDPVKAALLRGEAAVKADRIEEAAASFRQGRDYYRSAELYESLGMLVEAAEAYEEGGAAEDAGKAYLQAGRKERAAAAFEAGGQYAVAAGLYEDLSDAEKAVALFEKAGMAFKAAAAAAHLGETQRAIMLLQRVAPEDVHFKDAIEMLAALFLEVGQTGLAQERLHQALQGRPVSLDTIPLFYWLGRCAEVAGDRTEALAVYKKVLAVDFSFRDVPHRIRQIESGAPPTPAPEAPPAADAAMALVSPTGPRFVTKEEVGRGPLGVLFRAEDQTDGRSIALRVLPEQVLRQELVGPVVAELVAAARISHPNLVRVLGLVDFEGQSCVLCELVRGSSLAEILRTGQRMSVQKCHSLGLTLAQVLAFIQARGMVHGSIRPSNIMMLAGVVKLADLGMSRLFRAIIPPDCYRAPEDRPDIAGDIFGLGAVIYHLLTGVEPKVRAHGPPVSRPSQLAPGVPARFDTFLLRCLEPRPEARFATIEEVVEALEAMITIG